MGVFCGVVVGSLTAHMPVCIMKDQALDQTLLSHHWCPDVLPQSMVLIWGRPLEVENSWLA